MPPARLTISRRRFLEGFGASAALAALAPLRLSAHAAIDAKDREPRALVVIHLAGGLDAHDVFVPFEHDDYHCVRPTLALKRSDLIALESGAAINRTCAALERLWKEGKLLALPHVGHRPPAASHFRSSEIWHTAADTDTVIASGWLGRAAQYLEAEAIPVTCFYGTRNAPRIFARDAASKRLCAMSPSTALNSSGGSWETALAEIAARTCATRGTEFYFVSIPGFDTHYAQKRTISQLLHETTSALARFQQQIEDRGVADRVLTFAYSEFGRTLAENHQGGTDHAAATMAFLLGRNVRTAGGTKKSPAFSLDLNPPTIVDFRAVYAGILRDWLRLPAAAILSCPVAPLTLLEAPRIG